MPWGSGVYTRTNGTYNGTEVWFDDDTNGFAIESDRHDTHDQDLATGINACLNKNGENAMTTDLQMGGNKLINLASGVNPTDAVNLSQLEASQLPLGTSPNQGLYWTGAAWSETSVLGADATDILENGTALSATYLGITATAKDSDAWGGYTPVVTDTDPGTYDPTTIYFITE